MSNNIIFARILMTLAHISSFGDIVLLTDMISIPARYDMSLRVSSGTRFTNSLKFKDSLRCRGSELGRHSTFLTTEKKISSVVGADSNKPCRLPPIISILGAAATGNARHI